MLSLWSGDTQLDGLSPVGDLEWTTQFARSEDTSGGGGLLVMTWAMPSLPRGYVHPALRRGALVTLKAGSLPLGTGVMSEPNRDEWKFTVDGLFRSAEWTAAVDGAGAPSTNPRTVVVEAIARGMLPGWKYVLADLPNVSVSVASETASRLNFVADVLNEYCRQNNKRWYIDQFSYVRIVDEPTTPTLALTPGTPGMATADDGTVSRLFGTYQSATAPDAFSPADAEIDAYTAGRFGQREDIEDLSDLGLMTGPDAEALLQSIVDAGKAEPKYAQSVEVSASQVTTLGGTSGELWQVALTPTMLRHHGWLDNDGALAYGKTRDWVIGTAQHAAARDTVVLTPINAAPRATAQIIKAQWQATKAGFK